MAFKVGDKVAWASQSQGSVKEKHGEVIAVLPAQKWPKDVIDGVFVHAARMFDGTPRDHESYIVAVKPGPRARIRLYWPLVRRLEADLRRT